MIRIVCAVVLLISYHGLLARAHGQDARAAKKEPATRPIKAPQPGNVQLASGLVGEYFRDVKNLDALATAGKPFLVRIDPKVEFPKVYGQFYNTRLSNNFAARWTGVLRIEDAGLYRVGSWSDDKVRVYIAGELAVDTTKPDADDSAWLELEAGDYPLRVEYFQGRGSAQAFFSIKRTEDADWETIPESMLFHVAGAEQNLEWDKPAWDAYAWDEKAWLRDFAPRFIKMDYGPFISHTIETTRIEKETVNKGIAIRLGNNSAMLFDTETLNSAAWWTHNGRMLTSKGVVFDESHGTNPAINGTVFMSMSVGPGWARSDDFADPRAAQLGPLPTDWAKYKGLYRNGERVILSYSVSGCDVLEMPAVQESASGPTFRRIFQIAPSRQLMRLKLSDGHQPAIGFRVVDAPAGSRLEESNGTTSLLIPSRGGVSRFIVEMRPGASEIVNVPEPVEDLSKLCAGGPARWPQVVETRGTLGSGDGPYVVDTLTTPLENPWDSWMRFGGLDFFSDGRAALCTWSGDVWIVSGIDDKLERLKWKRFAAGMFQPLGLRIVDDQIYVLGRDQITRLHDLNDDAEADFYENFNNDCIVTSSFHEFALDLQTDSRGNFYFAKGGPVRPGGRGWQQITDHNGCVLKVSNDGSKFEVFATGVRAPNGMGVGPNDEITVSDNEGTWTPTCRLSFVNKGDFLGVVDLAHATTQPADYKPPIVWLSHKETDNSSGGQAWVPDDRWGPFKGRMLHTSYGKADLFLVSTDRVDGIDQGGAIKFPNLSFDTGIMRPRFRPLDGQLYIAGLAAWQTRGAKDGALHRVRYTGKPVRMPSAIRVVSPTEVEITFTTPLDPQTAADPDSYSVEQWNYIWSKEYGSPEVSVDDPTKSQHDPAAVESVSISEDRRSVTLTIPSLRPVMTQKISLKVDSADGVEMEYDVYHTINRVPK